MIDDSETHYKEISERFTVLGFLGLFLGPVSSLGPNSCTPFPHKSWLGFFLVALLPFYLFELGKPPLNVGDNVGDVRHLTNQGQPANLIEL